MRLYRPFYCGLPACKGLPDEQVELLTRSVYRRKPGLSIFPVVAFILSLVGMWMVGPLSGWAGIGMFWAFLIVALAFGVPVVIYEGVSPISK